jgi:hypothetical protein
LAPMVLTLVLLGSALGSVAVPALADITPEQCDADLGVLLGDIEANRIAALQHIAGQITETEIPAERQALEAMREQIWDQEERQRGRAHHIWRDCMAAARAARK